MALYVHVGKGLNKIFGNLHRNRQIAKLKTSSKFRAIQYVPCEPIHNNYTGRIIMLIYDDDIHFIQQQVADAQTDAPDPNTTSQARLRASSFNGDQESTDGKLYCVTN